MKKPHNPGMSEKAWKELHALVAKLDLKYPEKVKDMDKPA